MKKERIFYYDLIKCIAIFLVCFYHVGNVNRNILASPSFAIYFNYFIIGIASMGVPLFFMANGAVLLNRDYTLKKHLTRIAVIFILLIVWSSISLLLMAPVYGDHYSLRSFIEISYQLKQGRTNHLWFLKALLYIYLLFPLIKALYDKNDKPLLIYLLSIALLFTFGSTFLNTVINTIGYVTGIGFMRPQHSYFVWINPFVNDSSYSLVYFIIGGLLAKNIETIHFKKRYLSGAALIALLALFLFGLIRTKTDNVLYDTVWMGYDSIMILIASMAVFLLCAKTTIKNDFIKKYISLIGANTLGIYFIHLILAAWLFKYYQLVPGNLLFNIVYTALILKLSLFIAVMLRKIPVLKKLVEV